MKICQYLAQLWTKVPVYPLFGPPYFITKTTHEWAHTFDSDWAIPTSCIPPKTVDGTRQSTCRNLPLSIAGRPTIPKLGSSMSYDMPHALREKEKKQRSEASPLRSWSAVDPQNLLHHYCCAECAWSKSNSSSVRGWSKLASSAAHSRRRQLLRTIRFQTGPGSWSTVKKIGLGSSTTCWITVNIRKWPA